MKFIISQKYFSTTQEQIKVRCIIDYGRTSDTYCFTEPIKHMGIFNGIITGQCSEITLYSDKSETAVCNLASICLPKFVMSDGTYDFEKLGEITEIVTQNLNKVIDLNFYPVPETRVSNLRHRPIGIGIQGLADVYCKMGYAFESEEAFNLNRKICERIYYHALKASCVLAQKYGTYSSYEGSPFSQGLLQFDMWGEGKYQLSEDLDWDGLRKNISRYGLRNSHLTALMPTASTSQIMGNSECFEPITSNIYVRKTLAGEFIVVNEHLVRELISNKLWNKQMYEEILYYNGSIQSIKEIPQDIRNRYKTAFEIKGINILKQAIERGPFIDQTQSMNIFMSVPNFDKLTSSHIYAWKNGLKTGMYYLRTQPAVDPIKFGISPDTIRRLKEKADITGEQPEYCVYVRRGQKPPEGCVVCSS
jgi:ribonucleoside-diphosphate reductase alpha subunit